MKSSVSIFLSVMVAIMLSACSGKTIYSEYYDLPLGGWEADSSLSYSFQIADSSGEYDVFILFRHTQAYPYQNVWLFVDFLKGDILQQTDTIEFYLADEHGRWLGNGYGNVREMPVIYDAHRIFPTDSCSFVIRQGMREEKLKGVSSVGMKILKSRK